MASIKTFVAADGSTKYRFQVAGGGAMEAALFRVDGRERPNIICLSTQIGCAVGCPFCATSLDKFYRNLSADEMLLEVSHILDKALADGAPEKSFEISFMGMGEPLANLSNLLICIESIHQHYPGISRLSLSTAGPAKRIESLTATLPDMPPIHLQISLHATNEDLRRRLVPNAPESIVGLLEAGRQFNQKTGDKVCLNYVLLRGMNDSIEDALWLSDLDPNVFYIKITRLNNTVGMPPWFAPSSPETMQNFCNVLQSKGMPHKIFIGNGLDVYASCGQLAAAEMEL